MIGGIGIWELIIILVIILLLFGATRLKDIGKGLGEGIREFKKAARGLTEEEPPAKEEKSETEKLREAARALGISVEGKTDEQLRKEIAARVGK